MKCTIYLNIGTEEIKIDISPDSLVSNQEELLNFLLQSEQWPQIKEAIESKLKIGEKSSELRQDAYLSRSEESKVDKKKVITNITAYAIPNYNGEELKLKFPNIKFPKTDLSKYKIQLVSKYTPKYGQPVYGITYNSKGEEIILIDSDIKHLRVLANYLTSRIKIEEQGILDDIRSDETNEDAALLEAVKNSYSGPIKNEINLLIDFQNRRSKYRQNKDVVAVKYKTPDGEEVEETISLFRALDTLCSHIIDGYKSVATFKDPILSALNDSIQYSRYDTGKISKKNFVNIILNNGLLKDSFPKDSEIIENLQKIFGWSEKTVKDLFFEKGKFSYKNFVAFFNEDINDDNNFINLFQTFFKAEQSRYLNPKFDDSKDISDQNKKYIGTRWEILFEFLKNRDQNFAKKTKSEGNYLVFKSFFPTLQSSYGYGFNDVINLPNYTYYKDMFIQEIKGSYFVFENYATENQWTQKFNSILEAKLFIDNRNQVISSNSQYRFNQRNQDDNGNFYSDDEGERWVRLTKYIPEGTIISVIDYNVPRNIQKKIYGTVWANFIFGDATMDEFKIFMRSQENELRQYLNDDQIETVLYNLDSPKKVALFISQLFNPKLVKYEGNENYTGLDDKEEHKEQNANIILGIAYDINKAGLRQYLIHKVSGGNAYIIPIKDKKILEEYKKGDRTYPIVQLWKAAAESLKKKGIDIPISIITQEDIENYNQGKEDSMQIDERAKAFISSQDILGNGEGTRIYINVSRALSSDMYHEYVHLILGMLKLINPDSYNTLLSTVWDKGNKNKKELFLKQHQNYPMELILEEFFVDRFTESVLKNRGNLNDFLNPELIETYKLFTPNMKEDKELSLTTESIESLQKMSLFEVLVNFNHDIAAYLQNNKKMFGDNEETSLDNLKVDRRKINWMKEQMGKKDKDKKPILEENC